MRTRSGSGSTPSSAPANLPKLTALRGRRYTFGAVPSDNSEPGAGQPTEGPDVREQGFGLQLRALGTTDSDGVDGCAVLHLGGRIDPTNVGRFRDRCGAVVEAGYLRLILDCTALDTLSGTAIGAFAALQQHLRLRGGDLVLLNLREPDHEIFRLLGFADLIPVALDVEEAVSHLASPGQAAPAVLFPHVLECPTCTTRLRAVKPGRFRCSSCQAVLAINHGAQVFAA